ncbi:MAG: Na+/H+ antiporter subunit E [Eubacteriales bacterium]
MFIILELFWIILNGKVTLEVILIGLIVSAIIYAFMCHFMDFSIAFDKKLMKRGSLYVKYIILLMREIVVSNIHTIHLLTTSKYDIEPAVMTFEVDLQTTLAKVVLANSITLTPGTITSDLTGQVLTIHALDRDFLEGIENCEFVQLLRKIEEV